jgi:hypothetical protein
MLMLNLCALAQSNELHGNANNFSIQRTAFTTEYDLIQTDRNGKVLWRTTPKDTVGCNEAYYSVISFTEVYNGYILSNANDYDYWLVARKEVITANIYPNPASTEIYIALDNFADDLYINMYDVQMRHLLSYKLDNFINNLQLPKLADGTYLVEVRNTRSIIKTAKICLIQNLY